MIYDPVHQQPVVSFARIRSALSWFEALLEQEKISVTEGSELKAALELGKSLGTEHGAHEASFDPRLLAQPLGLAYLASGLYAVRDSKSFRKLLPKIRNVAAAAGLPLVVPTSSQSQQRDFVFELQIAVLFAAIGAEVELHSEPDVVASYDAERWDVACKLIYSQNTMTLNDRIEKGIDQILQFPGTRGLVATGLTNRVEHKTFLPLISAAANEWAFFSDFEAARKALDAELERAHAAVRAEKGIRFIADAEGHKFRGVYTFVQTLAAVGPVPVLMTGGGYIPRAEMIENAIFGPEEDLIKRLHQKAHEIFAA